VSVAIALLLLLPSPVPADDGPSPQRFLFLYSDHSTLAANVEATEGAISTFDRSLGARYEAFSEYRDNQRFPGPEEDAAFVREVVRKYRGQHFDAILAFGAAALTFAVSQRSEFEGEPPIVFGGIGDAVVARLDLPQAVHGIRSVYSLPETYALARRLQPDATRTVVMTGSGVFDRSWQETAREELASMTGPPIEFVSGLTLEEFAAFAAALDPSTILIILTIYRDAAGQSFTPVNAGEIIARASAAPSYAAYDTFIGRGVVGGQVQRFRDIGAAMAEQALTLGQGAGDVKPMLAVPSRPVVDWRQLRRFGLDPELLPPGTLLEYYTPSVWARYRWAILLAAGVILAQSATIAALILQERRRLAAERKVAEQRMALAHVSRVAQLGELSGALAHELNQPLTSILANAEAGAQLAQREPTDLAELVAILKDIADDDRRAARIIVELRRLMSKGETNVEQLNLNDIVATAVALVASEFVVRQVEVETRLARGYLRVDGNRVQLKQVILNLLLNAADAMADQPIATRRIVVSTRVRTDDWREVTVEDSGPGLAQEVADDPFRAFVTTKPNGLGLGLSICRTIVQSHSGTLGFDPDRKKGTMAILALPPA
jgi:signal transduction histidine kinase